MEFEGYEAEPAYNHALEISEAREVVIRLSKFYNLAAGVQVDNNYTDGLVDIGYCEFTDCIEGVEVNRHPQATVRYSEFKAGAYGGVAVLFDEISYGGLTACTISDYEIVDPNVGAVTILNTSNMYFFGTQVTDNTKGVVLENTAALRVFGGSIANNATGIEVPVPTDGSPNKSNIFLFAQAEVNDNAIGIHIPKGGSNAMDGNLYGMVLMDCAELKNNTTGILGKDIVLQIDAYINAGTSDPNLIRPNKIHGTGLYFNICYSANSLVDEVPARGNYWGDNGISFWDYKINRENTGDCFTFGGILDPSLAVTTAPIGCNDDEVIEPTDGGVGTLDPVILSDSLVGSGPSCLLQIHNALVQANEIHDAGYRQFRAGFYDASEQLFAQTASISTFEQASVSAMCKHYINIAKVMAYANVPSARFEEPVSEVTASTLLVFPNPTTAEFSIVLNEKEFDLKVIDLMGKVMHSGFYKDVVTINAASWTPGIYLVEIKDRTTNTYSREKVMVLD